jgi:hypothetical protein
MLNLFRIGIQAKNSTKLSAPGKSMRIIKKLNGYKMVIVFF